MATLNMRYGGKIVSLPEGINFSPGNYGTARLNYRVNSMSVGKLGLTTNTNAKEYCGLQIRVGGKVCFIGRVSSTSYISGDSVDYHGSSTGSRSSKVSTASESKQSNTTLPITYYSSSMKTSTSLFTSVTKTQQVETNSYTYEQLYSTGIDTYGNGSGNATSAAAPVIRTVTNSTGSTVTSRTVSEAILTNSSFSASCYNSVVISQGYYTTAGHKWGQKPSAGSSIIYTRSTQVISVTSKFKSSAWNANNPAKQIQTTLQASNYATVATSVNTIDYQQNAGAISSTTSSTSKDNGVVYGQSLSEYRKTTTSKKAYTHTVYATRNENVTITSGTFVDKRTTSWGTNGYTQTFGSYDSRWTYYWTSCKKRTTSSYNTYTHREYSTRSYTGSTYYTSITRSTTSVSETIHNMNV